MNKIRLADPGLLLAFYLLFATWAPGLQASICSELQALPRVSSEGERIDNDFFDDYYVLRKKGVYYIRATKKIRLGFSSITAVMNNLEAFDKFMPGYENIRVKKNSGGEILTAIEFSPPFSPVDSRFTNEVEVRESPARYEQCWMQLDPGDDRVIKKFKNAPETNKGFWAIESAGNDKIEINYFSAIEPPMKIPGFVYKWILKNSYQAAFEALIERTTRTASPGA